MKWILAFLLNTWVCQAALSNEMDFSRQKENARTKGYKEVDRDEKERHRETKNTFLIILLVFFFFFALCEFNCAVLMSQIY